MLIRKFKGADTEELVDIWYNASVIAHSFIPKEMWESHKKEVSKKYLPESETWVAEENGCLLGFISIQGNYIGGLFVAPARQGRGIGTSLIRQVKKVQNIVHVSVYSKNSNAQRFYIKNGFKYESKEVQQETGEIVINMVLE